MIYTQYNTQKKKNFYYYQQNVHLEQTAIAAPIDKLISSNIVPTLKQIILIAASKNRTWNFINSMFAEEIWSQLDKPPWFKHFPFIWRPVVCPL